MRFPIDPNGLLNEKLSTEYKLDIRTRADQLWSYIGQRLLRTLQLVSHRERARARADYH